MPLMQSSQAKLLYNEGRRAPGFATVLSRRRVQYVAIPDAVSSPTRTVAYPIQPQQSSLPSVEDTCQSIYS